MTIEQKFWVFTMISMAALFGHTDLLWVQWLSAIYLLIGNIVMLLEKQKPKN